MHKGRHTPRQWQGKFFKCGMRCWYCLTPLLIEEAQKEHQTPLSRGGTDNIDNIVPACNVCNQRKGQRTEAEFRAAFSRAFELVTTIDAPLSVLPLEQRDKRPIYELRKENETVSWAWRNPA